MRRWTFISAAAGLAFAAPAGAQSLGTQAENLDCAIWASAMAGNMQDPDVAAGFGYVMNWFIGLYEGASGSRIDTAMTARTAQLEDADLVAIEARCAPRMEQYGSRLSVLGEQLQAQGD